MAEDELIKKFVELNSQAEQLLNEDKIQEAKQKYLDVIEAYHAIDKSTLERFHKELAYDQVTALFKKVNEARERVQVPYNLIAAGVLVIAFSVLIFLNPSIVGLTSLEDTVRQPVNITFASTKVQQVTLRDRPLSLSASGEFLGSVKLYYKKGEKLELILDSDKIQGNKFTDLCTETCEISADSNTIELFAQVSEGAKLVITELSYKVQRQDNSAPAWSGKTRTFKLPGGKSTTIDLAEHFTDPENDPLVYLSTTDEGLDVIVQNSKVTITPTGSGTKHIVFIASDLLEVTRIPVTIEIT